jgi:hypothetical protein
MDLVSNPGERQDGADSLPLRITTQMTSKAEFKDDEEGFFKVGPEKKLSKNFSLNKISCVG